MLRRFRSCRDVEISVSTVSRAVSAGRWGSIVAALLVGLITAMAASRACAQPPDSLTGAEIAIYQGSDRSQMLIKGAQAEATLTLYASAPPDDLAAIATTFEKKYGVKLRIWRASSENLLQRAIAEARAGRFDVDVFETNGTEMESLHRERLLQAVTTPYLAELMPAAVRSHREWVGTRLNSLVAAYNTGLIDRETLPKSYDELLNPKWKGKLGIEADDFDWFAAVVKDLDEERGLMLFRDIVATNGISVRKGHTLLANLVVSGEVPLALNVYQYKAAQLKTDGAPIDWFVIPPEIARFQGAGVSARAPHPHAALLLLDFLLSDAQQLPMRRDYAPSSSRARFQTGEHPAKVIDPAIVLDEGDKWSNRYKDIVVNKSR